MSKTPKLRTTLTRRGLLIDVMFTAQIGQAWFSVMGYTVIQGMPGVMGQLHAFREHARTMAAIEILKREDKKEKRQ